MIIKNFSKFSVNEVKTSKLNDILDVDNLTFSIEIELETGDDNFDEYIEDKYVHEFIDKIRNVIKKDIKRLELEWNVKIEKFLEKILDKISLDYHEDDVIERLLDPQKYTGVKSFIVEQIYPLYVNYFQVDNIKYLEDKLWEHLPNFTKKWNEHLKYEIDNTLKRGIEISNKTFFTNIGDLLELIDDFYKDFQSDDYWQFNERTGIHLNIGHKNSVKWNPIKGILFLDDVEIDSFAFKGMEWRWESPFTKSIKSKILEDGEIISASMKLLREGDLKKLEDILNKKLESIVKEIGFKNFGLNLLNIKTSNYIEFRYPGGDISKSTLIEKVKYFTYITKLMTDLDFERELYLKKLYKFLDREL
jgi:hypothetical protein